ncbi:uncharacterized protein TRIVIDRAFT_226061 [Trichoderma virens Gv29-8]|uniref:SnoaL-like domain-containing protein n=1 Tax=Hypocrea virens (strain Gv29-8 / FGSC 10586) TaxID=413071 RepID=G9N590_HYPVG|nr:uncharacterized protein TRIVIDRAFT_226061 [Trichoderma virens Gv29-8]EHK17935.1 hypothetical protein TRIVIDRAFT_226061 [Trichoderma virens Gv29-8]UKZ54200.1 hypothetical protein TrVGV298_008007 [Trichoderma virens]
MEYPTISTSWPLPEPSQEVKNLLNLFFTLADSKEENVGSRLAKEVFTSDGEFLLPQGSFKGFLEIQESRKDAWAILQRRRHTVLKVYANNSHGLDLIMIGKLDVTTVQGKQSSNQFVARALIEERDSALRLKLYRVIAPAVEDKSPIIEVP